MTQNYSDKNFFENLGFQPLKRGGLIFISANESFNCCILLLKKGVRILGIDGFKLSEKETRPFMEYSIDWSKGQPSKQDIKEFFNNIPNFITHFEFIIDI